MALLITTAALQGCGGGGSDASTPAPAAAPPATTFPLLAGYKAFVIKGASDSYTISGTCAGNAAITEAAAVSSTFEGITGYSVSETTTVNLTNCTPASSATTSTDFYDTNYSPLGSSEPGVEYTKYATSPPALPISVKVGDTGIVATLTVYSDSSKTTVVGQRLLSYVIEAGTAKTAIANLVSKDYNTAGQLLSTQQSRYIISSDGLLTAVSIDVQESTTGTTHLVLTKI